MIFDTIFLISDNKIGSGMTKEELPVFVPLPIPNEKFVKMKIMKDPVEDHMTTYFIEFQELDKNIINYLKNNIVDNIVIRVGRIADSTIANYDLLKLYIKPIRVVMPDPKRSTMNNVKIYGIGAYNYALMMDKTFSTEMDSPQEFDNDRPVSVHTNQPSVVQKNKTYYGDGKPKERHVDNILPGGHVMHRNNNIGNLIQTKDNWVGETYNDTRFESFKTPELGVRANAINLRSKIKQGKNTLRTIISAWAPKSDGNLTASYYNQMAGFLGIGVDQVVTEADFANILKGIAWREGDQIGYFTDDIINRGVALAGNDSKVTITTGKFQTSFKSAGTKVIDQVNNGESVANTGSDTFGTVSYFNPNEAKRGKDLLDHILNMIHAKYGILSSNSSIDAGGVSNYLYKDLFTPNLNAYELLKYVYTWYPPYSINNPWIVDDAYYNESEKIAIGNGVFTPLNIFNISGLTAAPSSIMNFITSTTSEKFSITQIFNIVDSNLFYKDFDYHRLSTTSFNHKCLVDNIDTLIPAVTNDFSIILPDLNNDSSNEINSLNRMINISETMNIETNFDAVEFNNRNTLLLEHMRSNPELTRIRMRVDDLGFFQFGKKYYIQDADINNEHPLTPYKMTQTFTNASNKLQLDYDILFYRGDIDLNGKV